MLVEKRGRGEYGSLLSSARTVGALGTYSIVVGGEKLFTRHNATRVHGNHFSFDSCSLCVLTARQRGSKLHTCILASLRAASRDVNVLYKRVKHISE